MTINVFELHKERLNNLIEQCYKYILTRYTDNGGKRITQQQIKATIKSVIPNDYCLGLDNWFIIDGQTGIFLDKAMKFNFNITRTFLGITLTDEEFQELGRIAFLTKTNNNNSFEKFSELLQKCFDGKVGFWFYGRQLFYNFIGLSNLVKQEILYYHLLPVLINFTANIVNRDENKTYLMLFRDPKVIYYPIGFAPLTIDVKQVPLSDSILNISAFNVLH